MCDLDIVVVLESEPLLAPFGRIYIVARLQLMDDALQDVIDLWPFGHLLISTRLKSANRLLGVNFAFVSQPLGMLLSLGPVSSEPLAGCPTVRGW